MNFSRRKRFLLGFVAIVLVGLLVLAGGVSTLDVTSHTLYLLPKSTEQAETPTPPQPAVETADYASILGLVILIVVPLSILYLMLSPEARRRFLTQLVQVSAILVVIYFFTTRAWRNFAASIFGQNLTGELDLPANIELKFIEPFTPQSPTWLSGLISFILAAVIVFIIYRLVLLLRNLFSHERTASEKLEITARKALGRIQAGADLRDVILRCYHEMIRAVSEKRHLDRPESATPSEFSRSLEAAGLPVEQVQRLTRLFELVRYGAKHLGRSDEAEAVACLNAIIASLNRDSLAGGVMEDSALGDSP